MPVQVRRFQSRPVCVTCGRHPIIGLRITVTSGALERTGWTCLRHLHRTVRVLDRRNQAVMARMSRRDVAYVGSVTDPFTGKEFYG